MIYRLSNNARLHFDRPLRSCDRRASGLANGSERGRLHSPSVGRAHQDLLKVIATFR